METVYQSDFLFYGLIAAQIALCAAALVKTRKAEGRWLTPVTFFLIVMTVHPLIGYPNAILTANKTTWNSLGLQVYIAKAFAIVSIANVFTLIAYILAPRRLGKRLYRGVTRLTARSVPAVLNGRSRILIVGSVALIVVAFGRFGGLPGLSLKIGDNIAGLRYAETFREGNEFWNFLSNRGCQFLPLPCGILVLSMLRKRASAPWDIAMVLFSTAVVALTTERTPLMFLGLFVILVQIARGGRSAVLLLSPLLLVGYAASQALLYGQTDVLGSMQEGIATGLPEVHDFAQVMEDMGDSPERYWGLTYVPAVVPLPPFALAFTQQYSLRTVTLSALHIPLDAATGGPRLTYAGELYFNFGVAGVIVGGIFLGFVCRCFAGLFRRVARSKPESFTAVLLSSYGWMLCSFCFFLSGSGAASYVKTGILLLFIYGFGVRKRALRATRRLQPRVRGFAVQRPLVVSRAE